MSENDNSPNQSLAIVRTLQNSGQMALTEVGIPEWQGAIMLISELPDKARAASLLHKVASHGHPLPTETRSGAITTVHNPVADAATAAFQVIMEETPSDFDRGWLVRVAKGKADTKVRIAAGLRAVKQISKLPERQQAASLLHSLVLSEYSLPQDVQHGSMPISTNPVATAAISAFEQMMNEKTAFDQGWLVQVAMGKANEKVRVAAGLKAVRQASEIHDRQEAAAALNRIISDSYSFPTIPLGLCATNPVSDTACSQLSEIIRDPSADLGQGMLLTVAENEHGANLKLRRAAAARYVRQSISSEELDALGSMAWSCEFGLSSLVTSKKQEIAEAQRSRSKQPVSTPNPRRLTRG